MPTVVWCARVGHVTPVYIQEVVDEIVGAKQAGRMFVWVNRRDTNLPVALSIDHISSVQQHPESYEGLPPERLVYPKEGKESE